MDFSQIDTLDEGACYAKLLELLHPDGLVCPQCGEAHHLGVHRRHRDPVLDYQCSACGRVFNAWTGTFLQGTHRRPSQLVLILHGITQETSTARLARELGCSRKWLLTLRRQLKKQASTWFDHTEEVEPADDRNLDEGLDMRPEGPTVLTGNGSGSNGVGGRVTKLQAFLRPFPALTPHPSDQ